MSSGPPAPSVTPTTAAPVPAGAGCPPDAAPDERQLAGLTRAYVFGNFVIGCGVMIATGMLNVLASSLEVAITTAGWLVGAAGLSMAIGAPLLASLTSHIDRRFLLVSALTVYAVGHAACMLAPDFDLLLVVRMLAVLGAAVFTPQAAATVGLITPRERQAGTLTMLMLGWSLASVVGMPAGALIADYFGWRAGFALIAVLSTIAALWVARVTPRGLRVARISRAAWAATLRNRGLMLVLAVTLLFASGQFTLMTYIAPALSELTGGRSLWVAALMGLLGLMGVIGNTWASKRIDRVGSDGVVNRAVAAMLVAMLLWGLSGWSEALRWPLLVASIVAWGLGCFSSNSAQQARLYQLAPTLAPVSIALNSSGMYAGQTIGSAVGGAGLREFGMGALPWLAAVIVATSLLASLAATRLRRSTTA